MVRFEVGTSSGVVCANFQIGTLGQVFNDLSERPFLSLILVIWLGV